MRGNLGGLNALQRNVENLILGLEKDTIFIPQLINFDDMLWKFKGGEDAKPFANCSKEELLEVVQALTKQIQVMEGELNIKEHARQALSML